MGFCWFYMNFHDCEIAKIWRNYYLFYFYHKTDNISHSSASQADCHVESQLEKYMFMSVQIKLLSKIWNLIKLLHTVRKHILSVLYFISNNYSFSFNFNRLDLNFQYVCKVEVWQTYSMIDDQWNSMVAIEFKLKLQSHCFICVLMYLKIYMLVQILKKWSIFREKLWTSYFTYNISFFMLPVI